MAEIRVSRTGDDTFRVVVDEGASKTTHDVTATAAEIERYGGATPAERLVEASFRFLLDREPKESILRAFDLPVIERYFPEYPKKIASYM